MRLHRLPFLLIAPLLLAPLASVVRADAVFLLAAQHTWEAKRGIYITLENPGPALGTMKLALGIGDGQDWKFITATPPWELNHAYRVAAHLEKGKATLSVDGHEVGHADGVVFAPDPTPLRGAEVPPWGNAPTDYIIAERVLRVVVHGQNVVQHTWPALSDDPTVTVQKLFSPSPGWQDNHWHPAADDALQIEVIFKPLPQDLHKLSPLVDRYGQLRYGTWQGKITADTQLQADAADEQKRLAAMPPAGGVDPYGGDIASPWHSQATGFYRVERHKSFWWLITPTGLPCFYTGMCNAPNPTDNGTPVKDREFLFDQLPPHDGPFAAAWSPGVWGEPDNQYFCFDTANMIRKYGDAWREKATQLCTQRLRSFGFTGLGKWCAPYGDLPYVIVLSHPADPHSGKGKLDVFDPIACKRFSDTIAKQMQPHLRDPHLIGWSVGNEMDEIVRTDDLAALLAVQGATPAKRAIVADALEHAYGNDAAKFGEAWKTGGTTPEQLAAAPLVPPDSDVEAARHFYAAAYYKFIEQAVKSIDPDHMYLGFWIVPGWWQNDSDWSLIAPYCDCIGYDYYADRFADAHLEKLMQEGGKPALCGEFSFPPTYDGQRGLGVYPPEHVADDSAAGKRYTQWIHDATHNPNCVGTMWFEYRDEPLTGRGPGSGPAAVYDEHYAFGILDVTDRPKWNLVTAMRSANVTATADRLQAQ